MQNRRASSNATQQQSGGRRASTAGTTPRRDQNTEGTPVEDTPVAQRATAPGVAVVGEGDDSFVCWMAPVAGALLAVCRYGDAKRPGPNLIITAEAAHYVNVPVTTIRSALGRCGVEEAPITAKREIEALKRIGALQPAANRVSVMTVKSFGKAVRNIHKFTHQRLLDLEQLALAQPPASRYWAGSTGTPEHPATHGVLSPARVGIPAAAGPAGSGNHTPRPGGSRRGVGSDDEEEEEEDEDEEYGQDLHPGAREAQG